jgi:hypothetical protein
MYIDRLGAVPRQNINNEINPAIFQPRYAA